MLFFGKTGKIFHAVWHTRYDKTYISTSWIIAYWTAAMALPYMFGSSIESLPAFGQALTTEAAMSNDKSVLVIGLDPTLIDFSQPGYAVGMDATKVLDGLKSSEDELTRLGYSVQMCLR